MRTFAQKPNATQQATSVKSTIPGRAHFRQSHEANSILHLQRMIGNQAVQRLLQTNSEKLKVGLASTVSPRFANDFSRIPINPQATGAIRAKLAINTPGDKYEQEADRVADQVMRMAEAPLQRARSRGGRYPRFGKEQSGQQMKMLQGRNAERTTIAPFLQQMTSSPGQLLDSTTREFMESRFGHDFSRVRVHTDARAAESARAVNAQAYTVGRDVVFGPRQYAPETNAGKNLLAHELTHVIQQTVRLAQHREHLRISRTPDISIQRKIQNVRQAELVTFFSQPESLIPQSLKNKYLVEPTLMSTQRNVIRTLIRRVKMSKAPLSANGLKRLVLGQENDLGTALIICHNVTKALARGTSPINWSNVSREPDPLVYSLDGTNYTFDPAQFHWNASQYGSRNQQTVFYAMLSFDQFGIRDEGDWYHYYAMAATSYYRASGNLQTSKPAQLGSLTRATGGVVGRVVNALRDSSVTSSAAYEGWLLANAMSFLEGGFYGQTQAEVDAESDIHIQGASGGLKLKGRIPEENWRWYVPRAGSISLADLSNFRLRGNMIATTRSGIDGYFRIIIIRGTTPDHWYDTPDPYVKLPGFWGARTTTKIDTTSPTWNEGLTTMHHNGLSSIVLQLYDEDPVADDHIADFTADLRPRGKRSHIFNLTSGGSTLKVRVKAIGNVVLAKP
jgi:hypothetical protein